jgi:hypothetical protein
MIKVMGYSNSFDRLASMALILLSFSTICALIAGLIIGSIVLKSSAALDVLIFAGLHATGGLIGGIIGLILVNALKTRITVPN